MAGSKIAALSRSLGGTATTPTSWKPLEVQRNFSRLLLPLESSLAATAIQVLDTAKPGGDHVLSMCR